MIPIVIVIVVAVVVVVFVIIAVLLVIVVCKLQGNRRNSKGMPKYNIYMHIAMVMFCFHLYRQFKTEIFQNVSAHTIM